MPYLKRVIPRSDHSAIDQNAPAFRLGYRPALDGLRGLAVLAVMFHHVRINDTPLLTGGYLGVDVFFVLSGFLITTLLLEEHRSTGEISLRLFYARRALRLVPALVVFLAAVTAMVVVARAFHLYAYATTSGKAIVATLLYASSWVAALGLFDLGSLIHTWSLSVEEQFYLLWPPALVLLLRRSASSRTITASLVAASGISAALGEILWQRAGPADPGLRVSYGFDTRVGPLLLGSALGVIAVTGGLPRGEAAQRCLAAIAAAAALLVGWLIVAPTLLTSHVSGVQLHTITGWAVAAIIAWLLVRPSTVAAIALSTNWLVWTGRLSYALYLWHVPVYWFMVIALWGKVPLGASYAAGFVASFACAIASYWLVERRFLRLKARIRPSSGRRFRASMTAPDSAPLQPQVGAPALRTPDALPIEA